MTRGRTFAVVCAAMVGFAPWIVASAPAAEAAEVATLLDYRAAPGCPTVTQFVSVIAGRLGYSPFRTNAAQRVIVRIAAAGRALQGRLEWRDQAGAWIGEQSFPSRTGDCGELARAMGFALALQIQLMATTATEGRPAPAAPPVHGAAAAPAPPAATPAPAPASPASAAAPAPPAAATSAPAAAAAPPAAAASPAPAAASPAPAVELPPAVLPGAPALTASPRRPESNVRSPGRYFAVGAGTALGFGIADSAVPLARLLASVQWRHFALQLAGEGTAPSVTRRDDGAGFSQRAVFGEVAACGIRGRWRACGLAKAGQLRVVGEGIDVPRAVASLIAQTGIRLGLTQSLGERVEVTAHGDALALLTRRIVTLDAVPVWITPRLAALVGIDIAVRFP